MRKGVTRGEMTVQELIELLAVYPPGMRVVVDGYEDGYDDLEEPMMTVLAICLDAGENWWEGQHCDADDTRSAGNAVVKALALRRPRKSA